jgi:hypothetical protein
MAMSLDRILRVGTLVVSMALVLVAIGLQPVVAISNGSSLGWLTQPASASVNETITSVVGDPDGLPRIRVALFNGSGDRVRTAGIPIKLVASGGTPGADVDGDRVETNADGVAIFEPRIDLEGLGYRFVAEAADGASLNSGHIAKTPPSDPFDIRRGDVTACSGACSDTGSQGDTQASIQASSDGYLVLDVGGAELPCAGGAGASETVTFDVVSEELTSRTTVTVKLDASAVTKAANKYDVCFSSPTSTFTDKAGRTVGPGESGLLADCPRTVRLGTQACVVSRRRDKAGNVIVVFSVPPGDPRALVT